MCFEHSDLCIVICVFCVDSCVIKMPSTQTLCEKTSWGNEGEKREREKRKYNEKEGELNNGRKRKRKKEWEFGERAGVRKRTTKGMAEEKRKNRK